MSISKNIQDRDYMDSVQDFLDEVINTDNHKLAFELLRELGKNLAKQKEEIKNNPELIDYYNKIIVKAKFIALPLLDDKEVVELVRKYFTWQFRIPYYDFLEKFNFKLLNIFIYEDRDKIKENLRNVLLNNEQVITSKASKRKISEWLRDYNSKIGTGQADNLIKTQYFTDLKKIKELDESDRNRLRVLFDFYEKLKLSSMSPQGFEEEIPIVIDGNYYIFKQGELEPVSEKAQKARTVIGPPKTESEKKVEEIKEKEEEYSAGSIERKALEEEVSREKEIEDLQYMANKFIEGSLERRAIEEEIEKMSKL